MCVCAKILALLVIVVALPLTNATVTDNNLQAGKKEKKGRSTSSSSGERRDKSSKGSRDDSLEISIEELSAYRSSRESEEKITGWRKYHRVCPGCPGDMAKKATDRSIAWVCGGYQRARRTFKSVCMMRLRNCQDGTMFVKLYSGFCKAPQDGSPLGEHFFYDDKEKESEDDTDLSASTNKED